MGYIALSDALFSCYSEYDTMYLETTSSFFQTREEYWGHYVPFNDFRAYQYRNLDEVENLNLVNVEMVDADEKKMYINLLKGMLILYGNLRIIPSEVLNQPFITQGTQQHSS
ncbi:homeodomain-interacting protein kinase 1-like isoform X4 [Scomber scombrus]|uniref:Homeodomain-interacting protein kinase 1-like isoform X4 n=1 Tax=Scomber scombrus TaxID=13677 RepID=A0AAV1PRK1_SCOSC